MPIVNEVTEIFYLSDKFSKEFDKTFKKQVLNQCVHTNEPETSLTVSALFDSTCPKVCHIQREHSNCVFKGIATKGQIEHTGNRCFTNFITNLIAGLLVYRFLSKKPAIRGDYVDDKLLMLTLISNSQ
ncbi:hypothetical protein EZS27_026573 [termite gut metagenome]|uniref:Uncharacterized protein n=1 Tax=termite gut metagenome TaxID=433724 RepID=A0A5J4QQ33_9ZZZZ